MSYAHGGELVARALAAQGIGTIYTLCGGHIAPIYDGCLNHGIQIIDFRHEQAAAHAADAHARLRRDVGVAVVTAGPGVTDAVTGVANAFQARSPLVLLGGAAPIKTRSMGALQEMPQIELFQRITKASFSIERTEAIPGRLAEAFRIALSDRPGPVFIELPFDILFNVVDTPEIPGKMVAPNKKPGKAAVRQMLALLRKAQRPLIIAGTQVYWDGGSSELRDLTDQTGLPVFTSGGGRGALPMNHPHCFKLARTAVLEEADVVVLVGTPLDFRLRYGRKGWNPEAKLIQVENDPTEINHNRQAEVALLANARLVLEAMAEGLQGFQFGGWLERVRELESEEKAGLAPWAGNEEAPVNHFRFGAAINNAISSDTLIVADGGDIVSACAKVIDVTEPGHWLDPGPLGCLGVGAPFAIAAQHLNPEKRVLIISGDGSFGLNGFEFDTAVRFQLPIVSIVGNDAGWGQIRNPQIQMVGVERAAATSLASTRYDRVVEALGGFGQHVERPGEIEPALARAFASGRPACINVTLDPEGMAKSKASSAYIV